MQASDIQLLILGRSETSTSLTKFRITVPLLRCGITGGVKSGVEGSGDSGGMYIDAMTGSGKDTGGGGGGKEDTVVVVSGKRKNDGNTKTAGGSQQQEERAKMTGGSGDGGNEDSQFNNNASGSDTILKISKTNIHCILKNIQFISLIKI